MSSDGSELSNEAAADAVSDQPLNLFDLSGKVAVVTGGSRGLGRQMIRAFARCGADVVIASRKIQACQLLATEIEATTGRRALAATCHVGYWDQCDALIDQVYDEFGRCDILVNNAGLSPLYDSLADVTEALYDKVLDVNLKGPFRLMATAGKRMAESGTGGSIINISSIAAVQPTPNEAAYGAAKSGLNALSSAFAREYAPSVRVNTIMPGPFLTDIADAWDLDAFAKRAETTIPLRRGGLPHEVVGAALYLASDASSYTTGSVIKIDGGMAY